jgi:hypothetical protein
MSKRLMLIIMVGAFMCLPLASAWAELVHVPTEVLYYLPSGTNSAYNGVTVFTPIQQSNASTGVTKTYAIDMDGRAVHFWQKFSTSETVWDARLEANGNLSRSCVLPKPAGADPANVLNGFYGGCGALEEVDWQGNVVWRYVAYNAQFRSHDDYIKIWNKSLGQFTYLIIVWEARTQAEALAKGATGAVPANWSLDAIYEINQAKEIVWKWSFFDHLTTDPNDRTKFNINTVSTTRNAPTVDWLHCNSVGFNDATGHIVINSREFNEFFVIDHDGTFVSQSDYPSNYAAAASVTGDFKYRYGDPLNYSTSASIKKPGSTTTATSYPYNYTMTNGDVQLWGAHGAGFIPANAWGYQSGPAITAGVGDILLFNNWGCNGQPMGYFSQVQQINPRISGWASSNYVIDTSSLTAYHYPDTVPYVSATGLGMMNSATNQSRQVYWKWKPGQCFGLYSAHLGSAQRLPNNNTLLCSGESGHMVEVTYAYSASEAAAGTAPVIVWEYNNPINNGVPWKFNTDNGTDGGFQVNRAYRYGLDHPAFAGHLSFSGSWATSYKITTTPAESGVNVATTLTGNKPLTSACGGISQTTSPGGRGIPCSYATDANGLGKNPATAPASSGGGVRR